MSVVKVIKKSFKDQETGRNIEYERLAIIGTMDGQPYTLELKLDTAELLAAKMLLGSKEKLEVHSVPSNGESVNVTHKPAGDSSNDFLFDD